jgi:predicted dehydrogenase
MRAMKPRLRLGILGTGLAAKLLYLPALKDLHDRIEVVACANRRRQKAEHFAKLIGSPLVVDTAEDLIHLPQVQAVLISLPIDSQPEFIRIALRAGKAVLSEKPVAPSVAAAKRLLKSTARYEAPWMVGENIHFMPHVRKLLQWITAGRVGDLRVIEAVQINKMDSHNPYFHTDWRHKPSFVGGFVVDGGVHLAHVVRLCAGMPVHVESRTARFDPALAPLDTAVALLEFSGGVLGTWTSCFAGHYHGAILRISGSRGYAEIDWNRATLYDARGKQTVFESSVNSFYAQFAHFADVVNQGILPQVTPQEALQDLVLMESIVKS